MPQQKTKILEVKDLQIILGREEIVKNVSFSVEAGEYLSIIGPSGSGKTTLIRALIGTLPYAGKISWGPNIIIGYVPQKLDIERNVPLSLEDFLESKNKDGGKKEAQKYLRLVNLPKKLLKNPLGSLSGGEFQRALVALALVGNTNVLLFDEPTAGVDQPNEEQIYETLHRLQDEKEITIITITHDIDIAQRYSDKILSLSRHKTLFGKPKDVLKPENLADAYGHGHHAFFHHIHDNN
ncbi:MAG: metal ABC transporter ATP-binding protein [Candidatus Spechtbacteria bacterium]|nr:metal ABC transporter ATP-binding protein [Candidatus Spechtbacteria bacterium]